MNPKVGLLLLGVAAAVVFVMANPFGSRARTVRPIDDGDRGPELPPQAPPPPSVVVDPTDFGATRAPTSPDIAPAPDVAGVEGPALRGIVVDSASGLPLADAAVEAFPAAFEPGIVARPRRPAGTTPDPGARAPAARSKTDSAGRFSIAWSPDRPADLRASAAGHLEEVRSSVTADEPLRISLRAGQPIRGRVHRGDGVGVAGAVVRADTVPRDATSRGIRITSTTRTDDRGAFEVLGLPEIASTIVVTHADYMPASARATPEAPPPYLALIPALKVWIRVHSSDGSTGSAPVVQWSRTGTGGAPLGVGVVDLSAGGDSEPSDRSVSGLRTPDGYGPVKVPCSPSDGVVRFTVRSLGHLPWTSDDLPVPAGGGERTLDAPLERDPTVGSISGRLLDPDGRVVPFRPSEQVVAVRRTDGPALAPRALERDGAAQFDGLPAGTYELSATDRRFGATITVVTVEGGRATPVEIRLSAPASLRVRADVGSKRRVHFQLLRAGVPVAAFTEPRPGDDTDQDRSLTHFFAGVDGTLLLGLGVGRYTVRVLSPDLVSADAEVEVGPGAPGEIEIHAKPR